MWQKTQRIHGWTALGRKVACKPVQKGSSLRHFWPLQSHVSGATLLWQGSLLQMPLLSANRGVQRQVGCTQVLSWRQHRCSLSLLQQLSPVAHWQMVDAAAPNSADSMTVSGMVS